MVTVLAAQQSDVTLFGGLILIGFVIGTFGHIIRSRPLIVAGIVLIAAASTYYGFAIAKVR